MQQLNLPQYDFRMRKTGNVTEIFDEIRKKYIRLTPEEWVRQNFLKYLISEKGIPVTLLGVEKAIKLYGMTRRFDIVAYSRNGKPLLLVECKAPGVKISQKVFDQAATYNIQLRVAYLAVTNGLEHYGIKVDFNNNTCIFLTEIPDFITLSASRP